MSVISSAVILVYSQEEWRLMLPFQLPSWGRTEGILGCRKSEAVALIAAAALGPKLSFRGEHSQFLKQEEAV